MSLFLNRFGGIVSLQNARRGELEIEVNGRIHEPSKLLQDFATISAMDQDDQEINGKMLSQQIQTFNSEKGKINHFMELLPCDKKYCPLHLFTEHDTSNHFKYWILNDINHQNDLIETMRIFSMYSLSRKIMSFTSLIFDQ